MPLPAPAQPASLAGRRVDSTLLLCVAVALAAIVLAGCAAPGEPQPPRPVVPQPVSDLVARQSGDGVVLTFALPRSSTDREPLPEPPAVEIYRGLGPSGASPAKPQLRLAYTIPSAVVDTYLSEGRIRFADPQKTESAAGQVLVYLVRTRTSKRKASADSNLATVRIYPVPEPIRDVRARVTQDAIELAWSPPARMTTGAPVVPLAGYRIYRAELEPGSEAAAATDISKTMLKSPLELRAPTSSTAFRDSQFEFGRTYLYSVRSVAQYEADSAESADSQAAIVTAQDVFPPAAPRALVVVVVPATAEAAARVELSWDISPETDLAGYRVYRSEQEGTTGEILARELLLTPAFRDMSVAPGRRYFYRVTAVDRSGNESPPSNVVAAELPLATGDR